MRKLRKIGWKPLYTYSRPGSSCQLKKLKKSVQSCALSAVLCVPSVLCAKMAVCHVSPLLSMVLAPHRGKKRAEKTETAPPSLGLYIFVPPPPPRRAIGPPVLSMKRNVEFRRPVATTTLRTCASLNQFANLEGMRVFSERPIGMKAVETLQHKSR